MSDAWDALCTEWTRFDMDIIMYGKIPQIQLPSPEVDGAPTWVAVQAFYVGWCQENERSMDKEVLATMQKLRVASRGPNPSWKEEFKNLRQRFPGVSIELPVQTSNNSSSNNLVPQTGGPEKSSAAHDCPEHANKTSDSISPAEKKSSIANNPVPQPSRKTSKSSISTNHSPQRKTKKILIATNHSPQKKTKKISIATTPVPQPPQETKESSIATTPVSPPTKQSQGFVSPTRALQVQGYIVDQVLPNAPVQRSKSTRMCPIIQTLTAGRVVKPAFVPSPRSSEASSDGECDWEWDTLEDQELVQPLRAIYEILDEQWNRGRAMNLASEIRSVMKGPFVVIEDLKGFICDLEKRTGSIEALKDRFIAIAWKHRNFPKA